MTKEEALEILENLANVAIIQVGEEAAKDYERLKEYIN